MTSISPDFLPFSGPLSGLFRDGRGFSGFRPFQGDLHFLDKCLRRNPERLRKAENHVERRRADAFLKPRNIAPLQPAVTGKVSLTPSLADASPGNDLREAGTKLVDLVQTDRMPDPPARVAGTIGPVWRIWDLTEKISLLQMAPTDPIPPHPQARSSDREIRQKRAGKKFPSKTPTK